MRNKETKLLTLPEYGRNVQNMVDYCLTLNDKSVRQNCAEAIIQTMHSFSKTEKEREDYWQILWDHLYIMSDFQLDVDFPYEVTSKEEYESKLKPQLDHDHQYKPMYRHYGRNIERMINIVVNLPEGDERTELEKQTALQMKRHYISWNKESVSNSRIFSDLYELSKGEIYLDEHSCQLPEANELLGYTQPTQKKLETPSRKGKKLSVSRKNRQRRR